VVGNDANVAAMAAFRQGVATGELAASATLAYFLGVPRAPLWWGGVGYIVNGTLHTGSHGLAGELFLSGPRPDAEEPPRRREAMARDVRRLIAGDEGAAERLRDALRINVRFLAGIALPLDPARIVFGGTYGAFGATLESVFDEVREEVERGQAWLGGLPAPEFRRDPLWPRTIESGAAEMALDQLFRSEDGHGWNLLTRAARDVA